MLPCIPLTGRVGSESTTLPGLLEPSYSIMKGALLAPVLGWGKNRATLKVEKATYEVGVRSYEKSILTTFKETRNAVMNFNRIEEVCNLHAELERLAKSCVDLA